MYSDWELERHERFVSGHLEFGHHGSISPDTTGIRRLPRLILKQ
jgi:hypothetical protein